MQGGSDRPGPRIGRNDGGTRGSRSIRPIRRWRRTIWPAIPNRGSRSRTMLTACRQLLAHPVGASARASHASSAGSPDQPVRRRHIPLPSLGGLHPTGPPPRPSQSTPADHRKRRRREAGASGAAPRTRHRLKMRARVTLLTRARLTRRRIGRPVSRPLSRRLSVSDRRRHQPERTRISHDAAGCCRPTTLQRKPSSQVIAERPRGLSGSGKCLVDIVVAMRERDE